jgi:hypothetical protein
MWDEKNDTAKKLWQLAIQCLAKAEAHLPRTVDKEVYGTLIKANRLSDAWDELYMLAHQVGTVKPTFHNTMRTAMEAINALAGITKDVCSRYRPTGTLPS